MDVPFISSGAISRAHYALVRKVESATSLQSANQHLLTEIKSIRGQLTKPNLSSVRRLLCLLLRAEANVFIVTMQGILDYPHVLPYDRDTWISPSRHIRLRIVACGYAS